jgi:hypothetical protein
MKRLRCANDQLTAKQEEALAAIMRFVQGTAMMIAELPIEQRADTIGAARSAVIGSAAKLGITDAQLLRICTDGVEVVLREIETFGSRQWPNELSIRRLVELGLNAKK